MSRPHVQIVMATRNGAAHLPAQLRSFLDQSHDNWSLLAGDDGSQDGTRAILERFRADTPGHEISLHEGPGAGAAANFLSLVTRLRPGAHLAFSDQDDVWMPHKLSRAVEALAQAGPAGVYVCRTVLTDARLTPVGVSALPRRGVSFGNALVQNVLGGNTLVLGPDAAARLADSVPAALEAGVPFHDWWIYQIAAGAGLPVIVDPEPGLYYRQHGGNLLGTRRGLLAGLRRGVRVVTMDYAGWIGRNLGALQDCRALLDPAGRRLLATVLRLRAGPRARYAVGLTRLGVRRQRRAEDGLLRAMALAGRL